jgi:hypothetical protein
MATNYLAFTVGPVKDWIVKFHSLPPIPLTPNYYRHLPEITDSLFSSSGTYRWPWIRTPLPALTNSQRLAHPWKLEKKERNRQTQLHNDFLISQQALYITSPNPTNQLPHPHLQCYTHPWQMAPTQRSYRAWPTSHPTPTNLHPSLLFRVHPTSH